MKITQKKGFYEGKPTEFMDDVDDRERPAGVSVELRMRASSAVSVVLQQGLIKNCLLTAQMYNNNEIPWPKSGTIYQKTSTTK